MSQSPPVSADQQPVAPEGTGPVAIGHGLPRSDAFAKVTGRAEH